METEFDPECWIPIAGVAKILTQSKRTAARTVLLPGFPQPVRIGHPRWLTKEVQAWVLRHRAQLAA